MRELIKQNFKLWCQMRWIKMIDRESNKVLKLDGKTRRQRYVVQRLIERYNELFPDSKIRGN